MLASVRRSVRSWAAAAILLIALLAMVVTGFGTDGMGGLGGFGGGTQSATTLASVGSEEVTEQEVSDLVTRQFNRAREQQPSLDMRTFMSMGAFDQTLNTLIASAAIRLFGDEQGLVVSDRMIDREIVNIPAFRNFSGQFDQNTFRQALAAQNITEAALREDIARSLMQRQLLGPVALGAQVSEGVAREYANLLLERRAGTIGVVPSELLAQGINPTPQEVAAFYQQNRARFAIPERRVIRYAVIGEEQIAAASQPTEQEIAAYYRDNQATYGPRQTRTIQHIVLPDRNAANGFIQRVRGGTAFADAASQAGFSADDITFANQSQEQFAGQTTPDVARAAFQAQQGAVAGPVQSELGFHVVRVEQVTATPARPIAEVREEIATAVRQRKAADALGAIIARVEDQISEGASIEEIAQAERLQLVTTPPITATGQVPGQQFVFPPDLRPLLTSAFEIDAENSEPVVEQLQQNARYALVGLERAIPAAPPPLAQIQDQVRQALVQQRASERARALADQIVGRINGGMAPAQAFAQAGANLPAPEQVNMQRMEISRGGQQVPPPLIALFSLPQGRARVVPAPNGAGWFIVHHGQRTAGNAASQPQLVATTRTEFSQSAPDEIAQQFARALELRAGVERNDEAIAATRRRLSGDALQ